MYNEGMSDLIAPRPFNLSLPPGMHVQEVEGDLYDICSRLAEISPRIFVNLLTGDDQHAFAIMEHCIDGVDRMIFKVQTLDQRVLRKVEGIMALSLSERIAKAEQENYRFEADQKEQEFEELYDKLGAPMRRELERTGFITLRNMSYPKANHTAQRHRNHDH